jgi:hypothetical protein
VPRPEEIFDAFTTTIQGRAVESLLGHNQDVSSIARATELKGAIGTAIPSPKSTKSSLRAEPILDFVLVQESRGRFAKEKKVSISTLGQMFNGLHTSAGVVHQVPEHPVARGFHLSMWVPCCGC